MVRSRAQRGVSNHVAEAPAALALRDGRSKPAAWIVLLRVRAGIVRTAYAAETHFSGGASRTRSSMTA
jgi:hypothetical protein